MSTRSRATFCRCSDQPGVRDGLKAAIVDLPEARQDLGRRASSARTAKCSIARRLPLPDGATLMTFFDATASANVERALTDRNEALVAAEKLRNDFVKHVSYELRTPLTNIIGFTQLARRGGGVGPLNPKQVDYAGYIKSSSAALLAIINDILDLASIDAGALELRLEDVDVVEAMKAAAAGVQDRLSESRIDLRIVATDGVGSAARGRAAGATGLVQPALQRDRLFGGGPDGDVGGDAARDEVVFKVSAIAVAASLPKCSSACSIGSRAIRTARAIAGPASGCRSCARWSNCIRAGVVIDTAPGRAQRSPASFRWTQQGRRRRARNLWRRPRRNRSSRTYEWSRWRKRRGGSLELRGAGRGDDIGHRRGDGGLARAWRLRCSHRRSRSRQDRFRPRPHPSAR